MIFHGYVSHNQMVEKRDIGRFSMAMFDNQRVNSSIRTPNDEKFMGMGAHH